MISIAGFGTGVFVVVEINQMGKLFLAFVAFLASVSVGATEVSMPDKARVCATCHGENGKAIISPYPNLAGQNRDYLVYALKAYKNGDRKGGLANIMQQEAASLTEADIDEIADYFSKID